MKKYRYLSLILALVLLLSVLPMTTVAATMQGFDSAHHYPDGQGRHYHYYVFSNGTVVVHKNEVVSVDPALATTYPKGTTISSIVSGSAKHYYAHEHEFGFHSTRSGHGMACSCGEWHRMFPHQDPLEAEDGRCFCGYKFYDNAQLNVLWMRNVQLTPRFHRDTYEYTGKLTKDVDEITLVTPKLFDEMASLEAPENYKLKPGTNVFKFVVTSENKKETKTYTVTIEK